MIVNITAKNPGRIEDRRQPTSMHKESVVLRAYCPRCKEHYHFIVTTTDAEDVDEVCRACREIKTPAETASQTLEDFIKGMRG